MQIALIGRGTESAWIEIRSEMQMNNHIRHGWVVIWQGVI